MAWGGPPPLRALAAPLLPRGRVGALLSGAPRASQGPAVPRRIPAPQGEPRARESRGTHWCPRFLAARRRPAPRPCARRTCRHTFYTGSRQETDWRASLDPPCRHRRHARCRRPPPRLPVPGPGGSRPTPSPHPAAAGRGACLVRRPPAADPRPAAQTERLVPGRHIVHLHRGAGGAVPGGSRVGGQIVGGLFPGAGGGRAGRRSRRRLPCLRDRCVAHAAAHRSRAVEPNDSRVDEAAPDGRRGEEKVGSIVSRLPPRADPIPLPLSPPFSRCGATRSTATSWPRSTPTASTTARRPRRRSSTPPRTASRTRTWTGKRGGGGGVGGKRRASRPKKRRKTPPIDPILTSTPSATPNTPPSPTPPLEASSTSAPGA